MISYRPSSYWRLGQLSKYTSGLTADLAKQIVDAADPATRRIIRDERNRFSEALIGALPFAGGAALAYVGTRYLVPDEKKTAKAVGYGAAALALTVGAWWTFSHMTETTAAPPTPSGGGVVSEVATQAARDLVTEAEPRIRKIVDEEKARAVDAAKAGLPFAVASLAAFLATMFLVEDNDNTVKALGYTGTALLLGAGAWVALDKEMDAMTVV
jgi:hypothetical protein